MKASKNFGNNNSHIRWSKDGRYRYEEVVIGYVSPINDYSSIRLMEIIIFKNGSCLLGPDVCRLLDINDYPSYSIQSMKYSEVKEKYDIRKDLGMKKTTYEKRIFRKEKKRYG